MENEELDKEIENLSKNLVFVIEILTRIEENEAFKSGEFINEMVSVQSMKDRIYSCSKLILSIYDNQESLNKDYIEFEINVAKKFCIKSRTNLKKIEKRLNKVD